ncbi:MAG: hypothetical protein ACRD2L_23050, partial [Terriglobia bacterium]
LLDGFILTQDPRFIAKAEELIRRCIHPRDDIEARNLLDAERRWSYTVFLQALGRYLDFKIENGQFDKRYAYAQASLLHYARWMAGHEVAYLRRPEILEYPTETWSAQDMRKSDVFKFAAKHARAAERERFLERSAFFFHSSVGELISSKTRTLARPVVLMMSQGYMHGYFQRNPEESAPLAEGEPNFGVPEVFISQRERAKRKLKLLVLAGLGAILVLAILT